MYYQPVVTLPKRMVSSFQIYIDVINSPGQAKANPCLIKQLIMKTMMVAMMTVVNGSENDNK